MTATENSGVYDVGTFDNAQFDTINQPSTVNVFSTENSTFNLSVSSTVNIFSDLGREIQRDLTSYVNTVQSQVDAQKQILRTITSFSNVFSQSDFRLGKKVISTIKASSTTDSMISIIREPVSTVKALSQNRTIFTLNTASTVKALSQNSFERIFNRFTTSTLSVQSQIGALLRSAPDITRPVKAVITNLNRKLSILNKDRYIVMEDHTFKKGDYADPVTLQLKDEDGPVDLAGGQPKIQMLNRSGETVLDKDMTVTNASEGRVQYDWESGDPIDTAGVYRMEVDVMYADGVQTFPNDGYNTIEIEEDIE